MRNTYVYHFEFEAAPDPELSRRVHLYNALAHLRTGCEVLSTAVLLRSNAQHTALTDRVQYRRLGFSFDLVRVWRMPAERFLTAPVGLMPLAVLAQSPAGRIREQALPAQVDRIIERAEAEAKNRLSDVVLSAFLLAGMHQPDALLRAIFHSG